MEEKVYKDVLPCGIITTHTGRQYWLLSPNPISGDDWEETCMYRFPVVPIDDKVGYSGNTTLYSYARHLLVSHGTFTIEYKNIAKPIRVWDIGFENDER